MAEAPREDRVLVAPVRSLIQQRQIGNAVVSSIVFDLMKHFQNFGVQRPEKFVIGFVLG